MGKKGWLVVGGLLVFTGYVLGGTVLFHTPYEEPAVRLGLVLGSWLGLPQVFVKK